MIFVEYILTAIDVALDLLGAIGSLIAKAQGGNYEEPNRFAPLDVVDDPGVRETKD